MRLKAQGACPAQSRPNSRPELAARRSTIRTCQLPPRIKQQVSFTRSNWSVKSRSAYDDDEWGGFVDRHCMVAGVRRESNQVDGC